MENSTMTLEAMDQDITRRLRECEANFLKATKVAGSILNHVKEQNGQLKNMSKHFESCCISFDNIQHHFSRKQEPADVATPMPNSRLQQLSEMIDSPSMQSVHSRPDSTGSMTPEMPEFCTSAAKTPALLRGEYEKRFLNTSNSDFASSPARLMQSRMATKTPGFQQHAISRIRRGESPEVTPSRSAAMHLLTGQNDEPCTPPIPRDSTANIEETHTNVMHTSPRENDKQNCGTDEQFDMFTPMVDRLDTQTPGSTNTVSKVDISGDAELKTPTMRSPLAIASLNVPGIDASTMLKTPSVGAQYSSPSMLVPGSTRVEIVQRLEQSSAKNSKSQHDAQSSMPDNQNKSGTPLSGRVAQLNQADVTQHSNKQTRTRANPIKHTPRSIRSAARARTLVQQERAVHVLARQQDEGELDSEDEWDGPPPAFSLDLFPKYFQTGQGAVQITAVYSCFGAKEELDLDQVQSRVRDIDICSVEILLDLLVSRRQLSPNVRDDNVLYWKLI